MASFQRPSSNRDPRLEEIENELINIRAQVNTLLTSGKISSDYGARFSDLENQYQDIKNKFLDEHRKGSATSENTTNAITALILRCNELKSTLNTLVVQKEQDEVARRLPAEFVEKIESRRFADAESLLLRMGEKDQISIIVHNVYENSLASIDIIFDFVVSLTQIKPRFDFLKALSFEMRANGHRDVFKMISLAKLVKSGVLLQDNCSAIVKNKAQIVFNETVNDIKAAATESLKEAIYSRTYQTNVQVENLLNAIAVFRTDVSDEVMQRIASESYPAVEAVKIANDIFKTRLNHQKVSGLVALFRKLQVSEDLNNKAVLSIAGYLKQLLKASDLSAEKISTVNEVIESLPTCARNLIFAQSVSLLNKEQTQYIYAADFRQKEYVVFNTNRRYVFYSNDFQNQLADWNVKQIGDYFHFESRHFTNEYLYAAKCKNDIGSRWVFTCTLGGSMCAKSAWSVELDGDYCRLKNKEFNEYLYASDKWYEADIFTQGRNEYYNDNKSSSLFPKRNEFYRRYVFTSCDACYHGQNFLWQIRT